jgi:two-component system sensor histidine kinase QseC
MGRLASRLAQEQAFLVDAAHQLKTPLAVIQANAEALSGELPAHRSAEARQGLQAGLDRAVHAIHQLLAFGRSSADLASLNLQAFPLDDFVRQRMAFLGGRALAREVELEFESTANGACHTMLDPEAAASMLDNLLDNAIKYSPPGATVRVQLLRHDVGLLLRISDGGPGIPAAQRARVFERFYRIPGSDPPGSGLGLAIVEQAARRQGVGIHLAAGPNGSGLLVELRFAEALPVSS